MMKSLQCIITGKVQDVLFRSGIQSRAQDLGLKGWVRNLADGKLEALVQGDEASIDTLKKFLLQGTPMSRVEHVETKWIEYDKEYDTFEIR